MACTLLKVLALLLIVFWGIVRLAQGHTSEFDNGFQGTTTEVSDIALAFYSINFSYSGWENIYMIFEEVKNPKRNLIACGGVGLLVVTTLYVLANVSFLTAISHTQLLTSPAVAVTWGNVILGSASLLIPLSVLISVFGSSTGVVFSSARVTHAAARDKTMPEFLSFIHVNKYSPVPAIMLSSALAVIFVLPADIGNIINFLSLPMAVFGLLSDIALCIFRKTRPNAARFIKTPLVVPALSIAYNLFLIVMPVALSPKLEFLYAVCFVLAGLLLYVPFVSFNLRPKVLDQVEECLQMLLQVVPTSYSKVD